MTTNSTGKKHTIGVLITYFNECHLLTECLESLLQSSDQPDEIWVYDDASEKPAAPYIPEHPSIKLLRGEENIGPSRGRNILLQHCQSDYVHFHDSDDLFHSEWCSKVRNIIDTNTCDAVFTEISGSSIDTDEIASERVMEVRRLIDGQPLIEFSLEGFLLIPAGTYKRQVVLSIGGYNENIRLAEDFDFHTRLALLKISYQVIDEPLVHIRRRAAGRSQDWIGVWTSYIQAISQLRDQIPKEYRPLLADATHSAGSKLYKLNAIQDAKRAFDLALEIGPISYNGYNGLYSFLSRRFGPLFAEKSAKYLGQFYRQLLPLSVRRRLYKS